MNLNYLDGAKSFLETVKPAGDLIEDQGVDTAVAVLCDSPRAVLVIDILGMLLLAFALIAIEGEEVRIHHRGRH